MKYAHGIWDMHRKICIHHIEYAYVVTSSRQRMHIWDDVCISAKLTCAYVIYVEQHTSKYAYVIYVIYVVYLE